MNKLIEQRIVNSTIYLSGTIFPMNKSSYQSAQMLTNSHLINQAVLAESVLNVASKSNVEWNEFNFTEEEYQKNLTHPWVQWAMKGRRNATWLAYYAQMCLKQVSPRPEYGNDMDSLINLYIESIRENGRVSPNGKYFEPQDKKTPFPRLVPQLSEQFGVKTPQVYARYYAETYILNNQNDVEIDVHYKGRTVPHLIRYYHDKAIEEGLRYNPEV